MSDSGMELPQEVVDFFWMLFFAFLVLKLTHLILWSWWWVTAPIWGLIAFAIVRVPLLEALLSIAMKVRYLVKTYLTKNDYEMYD